MMATRPAGRMALRMVARIATACSSCQSWRISFRRYRSPSGTASKKFPPTASSRLAKGAFRQLRRPASTVSGRSNTAPPGLGVTLQQAPHQTGMAAADVHHPLEIAEIVVGEHRLLGGPGGGGHRRGEDIPALGVAIEVFDPVHAMVNVEGAATGAHRLLQGRPGNEVLTAEGCVDQLASPPGWSWHSSEE